MTAKPSPLYPLKFKPQFFEKIWGGDVIPRWCSNAPKGHQAIGEVFCLSGLNNQCSIISHGPLAGKSINELVANYQEELLGKQVYASHTKQFPLLIKIIDAAKDLSIQVHPDDKLAHSLDLPNGKNEMWYILQAKGEALITTGFNEASNPKKLKAYIQDNSLLQHLNQSPAKAGDAFYIPSGKIHTIGAGNTLVEVQQSSDTTYRIYDYDRRDDQGNPRELHLDMAMKALDFEDTDTGKLPEKNTPELLKSPYFSINKQKHTANKTLNYSPLDSFVVLFNIGDIFELNYQGETICINKMETVLIPACIQEIELIITTEASYLEIFC